MNVAPSLLAIVRRPLRALAAVAYPDACSACGAFIADGDADGDPVLCRTCADALEALEARPACPRCGAPLAVDGAPCPWCLGKGVRPFDAVLRLGVYEEPLRGLIHAMKYHGRWAVAEHLADRLIRAPGVLRLLRGADLLVPVPLHWWKQVRRGYNQSEVLARRLSERLARLGHGRIPVAGPARRTRDTGSQTLLASRAARRLNVRRAFAARWGCVRQVAGRRIVLVDDVMTSGSTLRAVARVLRRAGAAQVAVVAVAVADPRGSHFAVI